VDTQKILLRILNSVDHDERGMVIRDELLAASPGTVGQVVHAIFLAFAPPSQDVDREEFWETLSRKVGSKCRCDAQWYAKDPSTGGGDNIAFGCKTCALSSASCICVACFEAGDHEGHEFYLSKSDYGCCDCGDIYAWRRSGFCQNHPGPDESDDPSTRLDDWTGQMAKIFISVVVDLIAKKIIDSSDELALELFPALMKLSTLHDGFRRLTGRALLCSNNGPSAAELIFPVSHSLSPKLRQGWTNLAVDLMLDLEFKMEFAVIFSKFYNSMILERIGLVESETGRKLNTDIGEFTCQMLTRPDVAMRIVVDESFMSTLLQTLDEILDKSLTSYDAMAVDSGPGHGSANAYLRTIIEGVIGGNVEFGEETTSVEEILNFEIDHDHDNTPHSSPVHIPLLDHTHQLIKNHETIQTSVDLTYILDHPEVADLVVTDRKMSEEYFSNFFKILAKMQFMNPHRRRTDIHVEFPDSNWSNALVLQSDLVFSFWLIRAAIIRRQEELVCQEIIQQAVETLFALLEKWSNIFSLTQTPNDVFSLHCPMNRILGFLLGHVTDTLWVQSMVSKNFNLLTSLPIDARIFYSQAALGLWKRNGESVSMETEFYKATLLHHHLGSADLGLLRLALVNVCEKIVEKFFQKIFNHGDDHKTEKFNSILWLTAELISQQNELSFDETDLITYRLRSILGLQEKAFSALRDPLSERYTHTLMTPYLETMERALASIATKQSNATYKLNRREWFAIDFMSPYFTIRDFQKIDQEFLEQKFSLDEWFNCNRTMQPVIRSQYRDGFVSLISAPEIITIVFLSLMHVRETPDDFRSLRFLIHVILRLCYPVGPRWTASPCSSPNIPHQSHTITDFQSFEEITKIFESITTAIDGSCCHHPWCVLFQSSSDGRSASIINLLTELESREQSVEMKKWLNLVISQISTQCSQLANVTAPASPTKTPNLSEKRNLMQKKLLEKLSKKQAVFLSESTTGAETVQQESSSTIDCVICLSHNMSSRPSGQLVYFSSSSLRGFHPREFISIESALIPDESADMSNFLPFSSSMSRSRVITRTCGHKLHMDCWESLKSAAASTLVTCPYCNRPANAWIPTEGSNIETENMIGKCFKPSNPNGDIDNIVSLMSDLIDQIALSHRYPNSDTDLKSLTMAIPLVLRIFRSKIFSINVPDIDGMFSKTSRPLQRLMWDPTNDGLGQIFSNDFINTLSGYLTYVRKACDLDENISEEVCRRIAHLLMRPWMFRAHVMLHYLSEKPHELPFEEICSIDSALSVEDEFGLLVEQLVAQDTITTSNVDSLIRAAIVRSTTEQANEGHVPPGLIVDISREIKSQFFDTYIKREGMAKYIEIPNTTIRIVEYTPTVIPILPSIYQKLYTSYLHSKCVKCQTIPRLPVVCLLCGTLLCCNSECCATAGPVGEVSHHFATRCAPNGIGVFLQLSNSVVYLVGDKGRSVAHWGSLYLDAHGEEDYGLSKPLQLDVTGRFEKLRCEIRENSFIWKQGVKKFQWKPVGLL